VPYVFFCKKDVISWLITGTQKGRGCQHPQRKSLGVQSMGKISCLGWYHLLVAIYWFVSSHPVLCVQNLKALKVIGWAHRSVNFKRSVVEGDESRASGWEWSICFILENWNGRFWIPLRLVREQMSEENDHIAPGVVDNMRSRLWVMTNVNKGTQMEQGIKPAY
jgi:hypothetical protein